MRAQWRPEFDWSPPGRNWLAERFVNLFYFLALIAFLALSFVIVTVACSIWAVVWAAQRGLRQTADPLLVT